MSRVIRRPAANRDLVDLFRYYAREGGLRVADRFFAQAEATFALLAKRPGTGTLYEPDELLYAGLRHISISRYPNCLVFYRPIADGIEVYRVLHGARDIHGILAGDFGVIPDGGEGG